MYNVIIYYLLSAVACWKVRSAVHSVHITYRELMSEIITCNVSVSSKRLSISAVMTSGSDTAKGGVSEENVTRNGTGTL